MKTISTIILVFLSVFAVMAQPQKKTPQNPSQYPGYQKLQSQNTVTDIDGNVYHTVTIGTQVWMVENLKTTKFRNGDIIPNVTDSITWSKLTTGAYCNCWNDANNSTTYGSLYNWFAVNDSRNIAPLGWHIPTIEEWTTLTDYLGGTEVAGAKLKESSKIYWYENIGATNTSGFRALPGGRRFADGYFGELRFYGYWWSSSELDAEFAKRLVIIDEDNVIEELWAQKVAGLSVRCIKDK